MLAAAIPQILALAAMQTATPTVTTPVTMAPLWSEIHPPTRSCPAILKRDAV